MYKIENGNKHALYAQKGIQLLLSHSSLPLRKAQLVYGYGISLCLRINLPRWKVTEAEVEKAREARISNRRKLIEEYQREAEQEYTALSKVPSFMFGLALYIGEGKKYG